MDALAGLVEGYPAAETLEEGKQAHVHEVKDGQEWGAQDYIQGGDDVPEGL